MEDRAAAVPAEDGPPTSLEQRGPSPVREKPTKRANVGKQLGLERGCNVLGEQDGTKARMEGCK